MKPHATFIGMCALLIGPALTMPIHIWAHCDTMKGPVIVTAKAALEKGDVTPILKWVKKDDEDEIRRVFKETLAVRKKGPEAKELADRYFLESLVRIHRAGEGAPFTGLKSEEPGETMEAADKGLETGTVDALAKHVAVLAEKGISERFEKALDKKKHADENVAAGREYVEAYIDYVHYVERLHNDILGQGGEHGEHQEHSP